MPSWAPSVGRVGELECGESDRVPTARYLDIVQDEVLGAVIAAQLFGHVHKDEIRLLPKPPKGRAFVEMDLERGCVSEVGIS